MRILRNTSLGLVSLLAPFVLLLQACSSDSGGGASNRDVDLSSDPGSGAFVYDGPPPASAEIQQFKTSFYDALVVGERCGQCHSPGGSASTVFVDQTDVNNAWQKARSVANLADPASSAVVLRVAAGHNCWLGAEQSATCAATITSYIERWATGTTVSAATVQLMPRAVSSPSGTQVLPATSAELYALGLDLYAESELLGLLNRYCSECHSDTALVPQAPLFASDNPGVAYAALRGKVVLADPPSSRLVLRLQPDSHNCWDDCASNANTLANAIQRLSSVIPVTDLDDGLLFSMAQVLEKDGIVASSGGRFETSLIAKWEFREGIGTTTADTSGVAPEIPLSLSGQYQWLGSWGMRFSNGKAQGGVSGSRKLFDLIKGTGEYTVEAWVAPNNVTQEDAWILGYAGGPDSRNILLAQSLYNYESYNRSTATEDNNAGLPALSTDDDAELAQATLQHVVVTYDPVAGRRLYVNGQYTGDVDGAGGGLLNNWSESFAVVLGNNPGMGDPWAGTMMMAAVHNRALSAEQVFQNFDVGIGQKYYLLFSVAELLDREDVCHEVAADGRRTNYCYVGFEVSRFDDASYLFNTPFFTNLNPAGGDLDFEIEGIRLGINGKLAQVGQGFVNLRVRVDDSLFGDLGQSLSRQGTIIGLENGPDQDNFFLSFDAIASTSGLSGDGVVAPYFHTLVGAAAPDIGMRTFDEINASFAALTGVPVSSSSVSIVTGKTVAQTFNTIRRQLPGVADFQAFGSSHHMAATQLAAAYCDALVQDVTLREVIFPAPPVFDFSTPVADAGINWRGHVVAPLVDRAINTGLLDDSDRARIIDEVELLITDDRDLKPYKLVAGEYISDPDPTVHNKRDGLIYCLNDAPCPPSRTADVVKASCTAVLGSGVVLMQ